MAGVTFTIRGRCHVIVRLLVIPRKILVMHLCLICTKMRSHVFVSSSLPSVHLNGHDDLPPPQSCLTRGEKHDVFSLDAFSSLLPRESDLQGIPLAGLSLHPEAYSPFFSP